MLGYAAHKSSSSRVLPSLLPSLSPPPPPSLPLLPPTPRAASTKQPPLPEEVCVLSVLPQCQSAPLGSVPIYMGSSINIGGVRTPTGVVGGGWWVVAAERVGRVQGNSERWLRGAGPWVRMNGLGGSRGDLQQSKCLMLPSRPEKWSRR